jgi:hypothetical protein
VFLFVPVGVFHLFLIIRTMSTLRTRMQRGVSSAMRRCGDAAFRHIVMVPVEPASLEQKLCGHAMQVLD